MTSEELNETKGLLQQVDRPMTARELADIATDETSESTIRKHLKTLADRNEAYPWRGGRYWSRSPRVGLQAVLRELVAERGLTMTQLQDTLPTAYRVDLDTLREVVAALLKEGTLHGWMAYRDVSRRGFAAFAFDPDARLQALIQDQVGPEPVELDALVRAAEALRPTKALVKSAADRLVKEGRIFRWRAAVYSTHDPREAIMDMVMPRLEEEALTSRELKRLLPRGGNPSLLTEALRSASQTGRIAKITLGRRTVYGTPVALARAIMKDSTDRYGVQEEAFRAALDGPPERRESTLERSSAAEDLTPEALLSLIREARRHRSLSYIPIAEIRAALPAPSASLDEGLLNLAQSGAVHLIHHDRPEPDPNDIIRSRSGTVYGGVILSEDAG